MNTQQIISSSVQLPYALIPTEKQWESSENRGLSVLESGKSQRLIQQAISMIQSAKEIICLQSFLMENNPIIEEILVAQRRGVRVFILTSNSHLANQAYEEDESFARESYIQLLETQFKYQVMLRSHESFHAKYILIDPNTNPQGMLFTCNLTKKPLTENPELATKLSSEQVKELFAVFVYHFWEVSGYEQTTSKDFMNVSPIKQYQLPALKNIFLTCHDTEKCSLKISLKEAIQHAKKEIIISTFGFDIDHDLGKLLMQKVQSGVKVTVFTRSRSKAIHNQLSKLAEVGAEVFCQENLHAKFLLADGMKGFLFTANFEKHGLDESMEVGIALNSQQVGDLVDIVKGWENNFPYKIATSISLKEMKDKTYACFENQKLEIQKVIEKQEKETITANITLSKLQERLRAKQNRPFSKNISEFVIEWEWKLEKYGKDGDIVKNLGKGIDLMKSQIEIQNKDKNKKPEIITKHWLRVSNGVTGESILAIKDKELLSLSLYF